MKQVAMNEKALKTLLNYLYDKSDDVSKTEVKQTIDRFLNEQVIHFQGQILK